MRIAKGHFHRQRASPRTPFRSLSTTLLFSRLSFGCQRSLPETVMKTMRTLGRQICTRMPLRLWFFACSLLSVVALVSTVVTCFSQAFIVTLEATLVWEVTTIYSSAASKHLDLGRNPNSSDTDVEGPGSTLSDPGISIIGDRGTGTLDIIQGGKVTDTAIEIGENSGSRGDVEVDGKGSRLFDRGNATIGDRGEGKLDIRDGGEVCDGATEIGQNPGSRGDVEVDGKGSRFHDRGNATIGDRGEGRLDITDGGAFNDTNGTVAAEPGSSGTVVVDGNGSQWNNSG